MAVENKWAVADTFAKYRTAIIVRRTNGYGSRYQEPNLESTCLGHGHVKPC